MRKTLLIILLLFLSVGFSQQKKSDEPNPKKGIKTETILKYEYEEKFGELEVILEGKYIYKYDSNGNQIEWSMYNSDGSFFSKTIYKYDSNGNEIESSRYDSDGSLLWKTISQYDSNGNEIEWSWYNSDGSLEEKNIYKYDSKNRTIELIIYEYESRLGELQERPIIKTTYEYVEY